MKITKLLSTTALVCASLGTTLPAFAQDTATTQSPPAGQGAAEETGVVADDNLNPQSEVELESGEADTGGEIVVTGTRIRSPNLVSSVPITSIGQEQFTQTGSVTIGDVLNELPALRSTFSSANSTRFIGTTGLSLLDLRGLGTARTLVVVNGRRHVGAQEGQPQVDTNTIPTDLIERVDIVTGGTTAVYGSDAIAGVVNFVLKDDYEGLGARASASITDEGDGASYFAAVVAGKNFADGRGNLAIAVEYARQDQIRINQRDETRLRRQLQIVDSDPAEETSDADPDRIFLRDIRSANLSNDGTFIGICPTAVAADLPSFADVERRRAINCGPGNQPNLFRFNTDGTIRAAATPIRDFRPLSNNQQGGDGATLRDYGQLRPQLDRYLVNVVGHFELSEALVPYTELKYARVDSVQESSPTFAQGGSTTAFGFANNSAGIPIRFDNPFLSDQARTFIQSALPAGRTFFRVNRNNVDLGSRLERGKRETYRAVVGARGTFNDDWNYDVSANYGRVKNRVFSGNNRLQQRFELAVDAARAPDGRIVCRSQLPGVTTAATASNPANAARLAADIAACVPLNVFGIGAPSQAARDYVNTTTRFTGKNEQLDFLGFVNGDLSQLFELPGGPIGFVVGGEYREEDASSSFGEIVSSGQTFLNAIPDFDPPQKQKVKEAFAEVNVPIIRDAPLFEELTLNAAGRVSDYNNAVGTIYTYNVGGTYAPVQDIRFRATFSRAIRAPSLDDLYSATTQNFANVTDPCDIAFIGAGSANRAANCRAAGIPTDFINAETRAATLEIASGGNPDLREEKADSLVVGAVFQPRFLPGFSLSVDYFDIDIDNVITSASAQDIVDNCYDAATLNNQFCGLVFRDPSTFFFQRPGVLQSSLNFARRTTKGVDFDAAYRRNIGNLGKISLRGIATYIKERNNFEDLEDPNRIDQVLRELGDPRWATNFRADFTTGGLTFGYNFRFIEKQVTNEAEDIFSVQGRDPENPDYSDPSFYKNVYYHDVRLAYEVDKRFTFYGGIDNLTDRLPPLGLTGTTEGSGIYDNVGRRFYVGITIKQ